MRSCYGSASDLTSIQQNVAIAQVPTVTTKTAKSKAKTTKKMSDLQTSESNNLESNNDKQLMTTNKLPLEKKTSMEYDANGWRLVTTFAFFNFSL